MQDDTNNIIQKLRCCCIVKMVSTHHKSCAFQRRKSDNKNEMIGFNLDDDYEIIKLRCCLAKEVKVENMKDDRRINVVMMKLLQHPDMRTLDETCAYPNLIRGMKNKHNRNYKYEIVPKVQDEDKDDDSCFYPTNDNIESDKKARLLKPCVDLSSRRKVERMREAKNLIIKIANPNSNENVECTNQCMYVIGDVRH